MCASFFGFLVGSSTRTFSIYQYNALLKSYVLHCALPTFWVLLCGDTVLKGQRSFGYAGVRVGEASHPGPSGAGELSRILEIGSEPRMRQYGSGLVEVGDAEAFTSSGLVWALKVLGIPKVSSPKSMEKAYKRISLRVHPDKCPDQQSQASVCFQNLGRALSIVRYCSAGTQPLVDLPPFTRSTNASSNTGWSSFFRDRRNNAAAKPTVSFPKAAPCISVRLPVWPAREVLNKPDIKRYFNDLADEYRSVACEIWKGGIPQEGDVSDAAATFPVLFGLFLASPTCLNTFRLISAPAGHVILNTGGVLHYHDGYTLLRLHVDGHFSLLVLDWRNYRGFHYDSLPGIHAQAGREAFARIRRIPGCQRFHSILGVPEMPRQGPNNGCGILCGVAAFIVAKRVDRNNSSFGFSLTDELQWRTELLPRFAKSVMQHSVGYAPNPIYAAQPRVARVGPPEVVSTPMSVPHSNLGPASSCQGASLPQSPSASRTTESVNRRRNAHLLYFDGASRGNPGPAGVGAVLYAPAAQGGGIVWIGYCFIGSNETNNVAEYSAAILGLHASTRVSGIQFLDCHGDSDLVINQVNGTWQTRNFQLANLLAQLKQASTAIAVNGSNPCWRHV